MSTRRAAVVLLAVAALVLLPQAWLADWTGTEGRRVQIALEMVQRGDWWTPTLFFEPTWSKPPLHYWLLAICAQWFGDGYLAMRLPAMVLTALLAILAHALHRRAFGAGAAWVAALGVLTAPMVVFAFASAEIDAPFACCTAASLWLLAFGVARGQRAALAAAGVVGGLALLLKGPPYLVFAVGAWLVWWRHRGFAGCLAYLLPLLAVPVLYYGPLWAWIVPPGEFWGVANSETVGRLSTYNWGHVLDIPSFWVRALLVQLPLVCWCFWEFRSTRDARMGPEDLTLRMCSGAAVMAVAVLTLFPGKPTRYLLPNVPLFVFAVAPAAAHYARHCSAIGSFGRTVVRVLGIGGAVLLIALPFLPGSLPMRSAAFALVLGLVPIAVRRPAQLLAMSLWLPALATWTVLEDWRDRHELGPRARAPYGPLLRQELTALVGGEQGLQGIEGFGHVHGGLLLGAGLLPRGDEAVRRAPTAPWIVHEDKGESRLPVAEGYRERLRLCLRGDVFVVEERTRSGR